MSRFLAIILVVLATGGCTTEESIPVYILHNANIYTVNPEQPRVEAMAFRGERIVTLGSSAELLSEHPDATLLDAQGLTVVPGLIDAHAHLMNLGYHLIDVDLIGTITIDEVRDRLINFASDLGDGEWLTGRGWDQNDWTRKEYPTRRDLDDLFPGRPVWLKRVDGHVSWANTAALVAAGLDRIRSAPDPVGGKIVRDENGEPTGIFIDSAQDLVSDSIPERSLEQRRKAVQLAVDACTSHGLTGVHDAGIGRDTLALYQEAIRAGRFGLRVYAMVSDEGAAFDEVCESGGWTDESGRLTVRSVKMYIDGALGSRGASLLEPYSDDKQDTGLLSRSPSEFQERVRRAVECGLQVNTHAIGDRGNRVVLDAYEEVIGERIREGRHRIEHAQVLHPDDIERMGRLGVIAAVQPTHATSDMYWAEDRLGSERLRGAYAWRDLASAGVPLALGSDFPVEAVNPLLGFYAAVARRDTLGWPEGGWYPGQVLTREEALRGFTLDAAYAGFAENEVGSLEPGKRADFVVLSADIMNVPVEEIPSTKVLATYLDGEPVFGAMFSGL